MLYVVATPIGNMGDITLRALEVLREADIILCEDTRVTIKILNHYEIGTKNLISYHQHTGEQKTKKLVELVRDNKVALVTDAGTPGISDPGGLLIKELVEAGIEVLPIPGASAVTAVLSISGFPTDKFVFMGFVPHKKGRNKFLREALEQKYTVVFYESCHRIKRCLSELDKLSQESDKKKRLCIGRELTKKFETVYRGGVDKINVEDIDERGEFVLVISVNYNPQSELSD